MSIIVQEAIETPPEYDFKEGTLYKSIEYARNGNLYLIIGPGRKPECIAAVRLAGSNAPCYDDDIIKACLSPFEGTVLIKNN